MRNSARFAAFATPATMSLKRILDALLRLLTETDVTLAEFGSSTMLLALGVLLALPNDALNPSIPLFHTMTAFLPEWAWATLFLAFGAFQSISNLSRNHGARRYAASCAAGLFCGIGVLGAGVHPISLLGMCFMVQGAVNVVVYWHLGTRGEK